MRDLRVPYPVVVDNDYAVWSAFGNRYWPAIYLADQDGRIQGHQFGEGGYVELERSIQRLLGVEKDLHPGVGAGVEAAADWDSLRSPENYLGHERSENFASATFDRSAAAFDNPDHVAIVVHKLGLADGEEEYAELERQLAGGPDISVPTITLEGDANGAPHPEPASYAGKFTGPYEHRTIAGGVGHNLPREAPAEFARAVLDVAR